MSASKPAYSQIVAKKSTTIEVYYGYPDWWKLIYRSFTGSSGVYNINTKGQGPIGVRLDHILTRRLGLGLDVWYVNTNITGIYNPSKTLSSTNNVSFNANLTRVNAILKMTIHMAKHGKFDPYFHFGVGYLYSKYNFNSTNKAVYNVNNPLPQITGRVGMGLKYYFNPDIGMVIDVGLGGPLISIGVFKRWLKKEKVYLNKDIENLKDEEAY
ncbi:MAG: hypothetical protein H7329_08470 [Opitutaceae bacterium]|nr:hypothetical protein [Cytophagales bacterium]